MKKSSFLKLFIVFVALLALGVSCQKIANLLSFQVNDSASFTLPAAGLAMGALLTLPGVTVNSTSQSTYQSHNTSAQYVQNVTLDQLTLTTTNPSTQNFDFLKSVSIYIATDAVGSNKVLLASLSPVPTGQTSISLNPAGNTLDMYLKASSYTLITQVELTQALKQNTDVRADSRFNAHASLP
ncbi:MAG: hypothetical protein ACRYFK_12835 [Janthinobacterium lividum]